MPETDSTADAIRTSGLCKAFRAGNRRVEAVSGIDLTVAAGLQIGSLAAVVTGVQLPLTLLSGILLTLSLGPAWLRVLGHLNPMYYTVQAARDLAAGTITTAAAGIGSGVTAAAAALALCRGTRSYRRAMG